MSSALVGEIVVVDLFRADEEALLLRRCPRQQSRVDQRVIALVCSSFEVSPGGELLRRGPEALLLAFQIVVERRFERAFVHFVLLAAGSKAKHDCNSQNDHFDTRMELSPSHFLDARIVQINCVGSDFSSGQPVVPYLS